MLEQAWPSKTSCSSSCHSWWFLCTSSPTHLSLPCHRHLTLPPSLPFVKSTLLETNPVLSGAFTVAAACNSISSPLSLLSSARGAAIPAESLGECCDHVDIQKSRSQWELRQALSSLSVTLRMIIQAVLPGKDSPREWNACAEVSRHAFWFWATSIFFPNSKRNWPNCW